MKKQQHTMKEFGLSLVKAAMVTTALGRADHDVNAYLTLDEIANVIKVK